MTLSRRTRRGYTLIEMLAVMAILVVLGGIAAPALRTFTRDSHVKAGGDTLRGRIADARANAIEDNRPYRLSISPDGTKIRVSVDDPMSVAATEDSDEPTVIESELPKDVTVVRDEDALGPATTDDAGWIKVATFLPNGTCKEDSALLEVREPGSKSLLVRIRGLTATATISTGSLGGAKK